jgi:hypothetical protein
MNLQNGHLSESMTEGSKEMMARRLRGMLAGRDLTFEMLLIRAIRIISATV